MGSWAITLTRAELVHQTCIQFSRHRFGRVFFVVNSFTGDGFTNANFFATFSERIISNMFSSRSTIEDYPSSTFDIIEILKAFGNFLGVFFGAFALGSAMGCATALVSLETNLDSQEINFKFSQKTSFHSRKWHCARKIPTKAQGNLPHAHAKQE